MQSDDQTQLQSGKNNKEEEEGQRAGCAGLQLDRLWPKTRDGRERLIRP